MLCNTDIDGERLSLNTNSVILKKIYIFSCTGFASSYSYYTFIITITESLKSYIFLSNTALITDINDFLLIVLLLKNKVCLK